MTDTDTDWIVPGAEVAVYRHAPGNDDDLRYTTIEKVAAKSFTVAGVVERIQIETQESKRLGGTWNSYRYVVVPRDDPKVAQMEEAARKNRVAMRAVTAVKDWNIGAHRADREKVQAAIDALTALRDTL